jgi:hypothetical protein
VAQFQNEPSGGWRLGLVLLVPHRLVEGDHRRRGCVDLPGRVGLRLSYNRVVPALDRHAVRDGRPISLSP